MKFRQMLEILKQSIQQMLKKQENYNACVNDVIAKLKNKVEDQEKMLFNLNKVNADMQNDLQRFQESVGNITENAKNSVRDMLENMKNEMIASTMENVKTVINQTMESAKNYMTNQVSDNIHKKIQLSLPDTVENLVRKAMYDEYYKRGLVKKESNEKYNANNVIIDNKNANNSYVDLSNGNIEQKNIITVKEQGSVMNNEYGEKNNFNTEENSRSFGNGGVITKIDTNQILKRIMEAVENKKKKLGDVQAVKTSENQTFNQMPTYQDNVAIQAEVNEEIENRFEKCNNIQNVTNIILQNVQSIILQSKLGAYTLPCFFDGEKIFGIYNPDHHAQIIMAGMSEEIMTSSPSYLQKIHIYPDCKHLSSLPNNAIATTKSECEIHYTKNAKIVTIMVNLPLCECCLHGIYKDYDISKSFEEFVDDFISGKIHLS